MTTMIEAICAGPGCRAGVTDRCPACHLTFCPACSTRHLPAGVGLCIDAPPPHIISKAETASRHRARMLLGIPLPGPGGGNRRGEPSEWSYDPRIDAAVAAMRFLYVDLNHLTDAEVALVRLAYDRADGFGVVVDGTLTWCATATEAVARGGASTRCARVLRLSDCWAP